jgi:hypothetical protein
MWGASLRAVIAFAGGYFIALIVERMLGLLLAVAQDAPGSGNSAPIGALSVVQENFLLLVLLGAIIAWLARAHVEAKLVGP